MSITVFTSKVFKEYEEYKENLRKELQGRDILWETIEDFCNNLVAAIKAENLSEFNARYLLRDYFVLCDVDYIAGKPETQLELMRILKARSERGKKNYLFSNLPIDKLEPGLDPAFLRFITDDCMFC